jgi:hypothetical protein
MNQQLSEAIKWFGLGVSVIPVKPRSKISAIRWVEYTRRLPTPDEIVRWFGRPTFRNYGVVCGKRHGQPGYLVAVDFDALTAGITWLSALNQETFTVATSRGLHAYFITDEPAQTVHFKGGDIKASGYVRGAGSTHPSGWIYSMVNDVPVMNIRSIRDVIDLPAKSQPAAQTRPQPLILSSNTSGFSNAWDSAESQQPTLIQTIRQRFSISDLLPDAQKTDPSGRWWIARCPLHDDNNPSMWIDTHRQLCGCYAGCNGGRPMDVINLAAQIWGVSNSEAISRFQNMLF